ncbi:MAG: hypothetical protein AAGC53_12015 [Actinomycetota bacterium]
MTSSSPTTTSRYPKARWWAAIGITVAVAGAALSTIWFVWALSRVEAGLDDVLVVTGADEVVTVTVEESVDWTIYLEPADRSLSGIRFSIQNVANGQDVPLSAARNDVAYRVAGRDGRPVSRARLEPGVYVIEVSPADAVLAIGPDLGERVQLMWLGALLIGLPTVLGGAGVAAVNLARALRPPAPPVGEGSLPPPPPPPGRP